MRPGRLILREIAHRRLSFALGVVSIGAAVACVVGAACLLRGHKIHIDRDLGAQQRSAETRLSELTDSYRKLTLRLGFNVRILPADQDLSDFYQAGFAAKLMDEQLVDRLAAADIITIRHLLPKLERRVPWTERGREIALIGTRGEVPLAFGAAKTPIVTRIPDGMIDAGHLLGLTPGEKVTLLGREFTVRRSVPEKGTRADISVWMDLAAAQDLLGLPGKINEIQAVDCRCAWADVQQVRTELQRILPETQVILTQDTAVVRAEARVAAEAEKVAALQQQQEYRHRLIARNASLVGALLSVGIVGCGVWVGLLAVVNTRGRRSEVGILRAVGVRAGTIFRILMARGALMGLAGGAVGCLVGAVVGIGGSRLGDGWWAGAGAVVDPWLLAATFAAAPLLAAIAGWAPAAVAAQRDPADVLSEM